MQIDELALAKLYWDFLLWNKAVGPLPWHPDQAECLEKFVPNIQFKNMDSLTNEEKRLETAKLFAEGGKVVGQLYQYLMQQLRSVRFEDADDIIFGLEFLHSAGATAMWQYHYSVPDYFARFIREFDRLDVPEERLRLYKLAKEPSVSELQGCIT